jgi:hypothetical protein
MAIAIPEPLKLHDRHLCGHHEPFQGFQPKLPLYFLRVKPASALHNNRSFIFIANKRTFPAQNDLTQLTLSLFKLFDLLAHIGQFVNWMPVRCHVAAPA